MIGIIVMTINGTNLEWQPFQGFELLYFVVGRAEAIVQHPLDHVGDVGLEGVTDARVDVVLVNHVESHAATLKDV